MFSNNIITTKLTKLRKRGRFTTSAKRSSTHPINRSRKSPTISWTILWVSGKCLLKCRCKWWLTILKCISSGWCHNTILSLGQTPPSNPQSTEACLISANSRHILKNSSLRIWQTVSNNSLCSCWKRTCLKSRDLWAETTQGQKTHLRILQP